MAASRDSLAAVAGPPEMAQPTRTESNTGQSQTGDSAAPKKKKHRGGKKKRNNRARKAEDGDEVEVQGRPSLLDAPTRSHQSSSFYRLGRNASNTSLESEALLDHREHGHVRNRRSSIGQSGAFTRPSIPFARHRGSTNSGPMSNYQRSRLAVASGSAVMEEDEGGNERTPLLSASSRTHSKPELPRTNSGRFGASHRSRRVSVNSKASSRRKLDVHPSHEESDYDVNNPPSVPTSPKMGSLDDPMIDELPNRVESYERGRDAVINMDGNQSGTPEFSPEALRRRQTVADLAEMDVCFPRDAGMSEIGEEDRHSFTGSSRVRRRRRGAQQWPDLEILEDWSREEKEERTHQEHVRAKKINEPVLVGGRLRPGRTVWHREEDEEPFRFTYFNETFDGTIHARTISDLCQEGSSFKDLFLPDPVELSDDSEDDEENPGLRTKAGHHDQQAAGVNGKLLGGQQSRQPSILPENIERLRSPPLSENHTRSNTPSGPNSTSATPRPADKPKRFGARPTFWLDVLQPTDLEMKVLAKAFGIHQLTTEDILMDEEREKVELFHNYYFVNYRSFEQDKDSDDYMDPINFYAVVFRDGVITFHHSMTPHPANVRRRIRQLNDYMSPTADWISYAIIDDITDAYTPRVAQIEKDVDDIDEEILYMHQTSADNAEGAPTNNGRSSDGKKNGNEKNSGQSEAGGDKTAGQLGGDMLRRVGESRKKVQGLHRLLGNKADVIKGFAKRCNEGWEVAPRSEIGLYLGDIQDHIVTMSSNLAHYERYVHLLATRLF